eukprot:TRINITY_DN23203_c0_g1_i2.p1 TRINITY_DN23203_c0_g1~~TRINITY_DN23203_c0_g1_i2.p1  ORF type:complete len:132 (+),score=18.32 TRINITY_DN23203_c0_g1_i2:270-665(+)
MILWNLHDGSQIRSFATSSVLCIKAHWEVMQAVTASNGGQDLMLWDLESGSALQHFPQRIAVRTIWVDWSTLQVCVAQANGAFSLCSLGDDTKALREMKGGDGEVILQVCGRPTMDIVKCITSSSAELRGD